jgi:hypothetical protein
MNVFGLLVLLAALAFQVWVTVRLWRSDFYDRPQKSAQSKLIWLVPVLGATIVLSVLSEEERSQRPPPTQSS